MTSSITLDFLLESYIWSWVASLIILSLSHEMGVWLNAWNLFIASFKEIIYLFIFLFFAWKYLVIWLIKKIRRVEENLYTSLLMVLKNFACYLWIICCCLQRKNILKHVLSLTFLIICILFQISKWVYTSQKIPPIKVWVQPLKMIFSSLPVAHLSNG